MKKWSLALLLSVAASASAASDPAAQSCADRAAPPATVATDSRTSRISLASQFHGRRQQSDARFAPTPALTEALRRIPVESSAVKRATSPLLPSAGAPSVPPAAQPGAAVPAPATLGVLATGDVGIFNPHNGLVSAIRRLNATATAADYYAVRTMTSQIAKGLPFQIDAIWFTADDSYSWSRNWQFQVVLEDKAAPFLPNLANKVVGPVTLDMQAPPWNIARVPPPPSQLNSFQIKVDLADTDYPASAALSIDDTAMDDSFNRPDEDLLKNNNWVECNTTVCLAQTATGTLKVTTNKLKNTGTGTVMAWRGADTTVGDCDPSTATAPCARYLIDYIDDAQLQLHMHDFDQRYTLDYDLSAPTAKTAGVFARAELGATTPLDKFYAVWVDKAAGQLKITTDTFGTVLAQTALAVPTGTLVVDVTGTDPVVISGKVGATTVTYTDTTNKFRGDISWGNICGVIFPNSGGGEIVDNLKTERNADLFVVAKMPVGESAYLLADAQPESRDYFATFNNNNGAGWLQVGDSVGTDCRKNRNTLLSLQVKDPNAGVHMFQRNSTMAALYLNCCSCPEIAYDCTFDPYLDECSPATPNLRPQYQVNQPIDLAFVFANDHAPDSTGAMDFFWLVCDDSDPTCSFLSCTPGTNCGGLGFALGTWTGAAGTPIPGLNTSTTTDLSNWDTDSFPDGTMFFLPGTPPTYTPPAAGNYHAYFIELHDVDGDGMPEPLNTDDYLPNRYISRPFKVGGCVATLPYQLKKNTLWMVKPNALSTCTAAQISATWAAVTPPFDPTTPFNIHEVDTRATLVTQLGGCTAPCNPWTVPVTVPGTTVPPVCITPVAAPSSSVDYFVVYQADQCTAGSLADQ